MEKEDFGQKITQMQGKMYRIARGYLRAEADCLDAISETILKAWQSQKSFRTSSFLTPGSFVF